MFELYNDVIEVSRKADLAANVKFDKVLQLINSKGALLTIKEVIRHEEDLDHTEILVKAGKDELTLEALVLNEKYQNEFNDEDKMFARAKLQKFKNIKEIIEETEEIEE